MIKRINIGCGAVKKVGFINIDNNPSCDPDILRDVNYGLPFDDNSIDEVICEHLIEHLKPKQFIRFFNECWRVLKEGCLLTVKAPYYNRKWAYIDPTHIRMINEYSFSFFIQKDYNSITAGITGWYELIKLFLNKDGGEITAIFKKTKEPNKWMEEENQIKFEQEK